MKREVWLDFLRVTACFMVMLVHSTEPFYLGGEGSLVLSVTDAFWVSVFEGIARCCVPLFVLASAWLQFPLHYSTGEFFRRRAVRILVPMLFWTVVYALVWGEPASNFKGLLLNFNYAAGHLWFVYMLLGLYLVMPLLSPWASNVSRRELEVYLGIWIVTTLIPFVREVSGGAPVLVQAADGLPAQALFPLWGEASWNTFGVFYYLSGFVGYMLVALYIKRFAGNTRISGLLGWSMFLVGFVIIAFGFMQRISASGEFPVEGPLGLAVGWETVISFCGLPVALTAVGLLLVFRRMSPQEGWFYRHFILPFSKAGYGMYLMHMLILGAVSAWLRAWLGTGTEGLLGVWTTPVQILGTAVLSFAATGLAACLLARIPRLGKVIVG